MPKLEPAVLDAIASVPTEITDRSLRHALWLEGLSNREAADVVRALNNRVLPDIADQLNNRLSEIGKRGFDRGPWTTQRLKELAAATKETIRGGVRAAGATLKKDLANIAMSEAEFQQKMLTEVLKDTPLQTDFVTPHRGALTAMISSRPIQGRLLSEWLSDLGQSTQKELMQNVHMGIAQGETVDQIRKRITGQKGLLTKKRYQLQALTRTSINHTVTQTREMMYELNSDVVSKVRFVATLDHKTTEICMSHDGQEYPISEGPRPPLHHQCRSTTVPVLKTFEELGIKGVKEPPTLTRIARNAEGKNYFVPGDMNYPKWLKTQPKEIQDLALGKGKAELFRQGKLPLTKPTMNPLTLKELRRRDGLPGKVGSTVKKSTPAKEKARETQRTRERASLSRAGKTARVPPDRGPTAAESALTNAQRSIPRQWKPKPAESEQYNQWMSKSVTMSDRSDILAFLQNPAELQAMERAGTAPLNRWIGRQSETMNRLFKSMPDKQAVTFRGLSGMNPQSLSDMARIGNVVELDASTVTTLNARTALARYAEPGTSALRGEQFAVLEYRTSSGMDLRKLNLTGHEDDLILQKGRKFKVVEVQELKHNGLTGKRIVFEEIVPPTKKLIPSEFDSFEAYRVEFKKRTAGLSIGDRMKSAKHLDQQVKELQALGTPESRKFASIQKRAAKLQKRVDDLNDEFDKWYAIHSTNPTNATQAEIARIMKEANRAHKARKTVDSLTRSEANKLLKTWGTKQRMKITNSKQFVKEGDTVTKDQIKSIRLQNTKARKWLASVTSVEDEMTSLDYKLKMYSNTRARCMVQSKTVKMSDFWGTDVNVHEIGHALEWHKPGGNRATLEFFEHRLKSSAAVRRKLVNLREKFPSANYDADEIAAIDDFDKIFDERMAYYTAKWYGVPQEDLLFAIEQTLAGNYAAPPTEIVSMGLQALYNNPVGLAMKDPEFCRFILGFLDGTLL